jgi:predicted esterase
MNIRSSDGTEIPLLLAGAPLEDAFAAVVLLHGRGGSAADILGLAKVVDVEGVAFVAPEARGNTWYPYSFLAPLEKNEPALSHALDTVGRTIAAIPETGTPVDRIVLAGFSQGACLSLEYAGRNPDRYGGVVAFSGGRIGPLGMSWREEGDLRGTPVFLGCSDVDAHIPLERVQESSTHFRERGAMVTERIYPGMGHTINEDEISEFERLLRSIG